MREHGVHMHGVMGEFETPEQLLAAAKQGSRSRLQAY